MAHLSDQQLLRLMQQQDQNAIAWLVDRYQRPLFNFAARFVNDADLAADVCQHAFVQLFLHAGELHSNENLKGWLFQVVRNRCLDELRRRHDLPFSRLERDDDDGALLPGIEDTALPPEAIVEQQQLQQILQAAIAELPLKYREVVALRYSADLSFAEIGEVLGIPEATAKTHFHRAKPLLRDALRRMGINSYAG